VLIKQPAYVSLSRNHEWCANFIHYEKAFDSVDRETLWKILKHYGTPWKLVSLICNTYYGMTCRITHADEMSESFEAKTGVRQG
jgi:hypothetical protein